MSSPAPSSQAFKYAVVSAGDGYKHLLGSIAATDGDRSLSMPFTRYYAEWGTPQSSYQLIIDSGIFILKNPLNSPLSTMTKLRSHHLIILKI